jgi:hypothetical protein
VLRSIFAGSCSVKIRPRPASEPGSLFTKITYVFGKLKFFSNELLIAGHAVLQIVLPLELGWYVQYLYKIKLDFLLRKTGASPKLKTEL